MAEIDFDFVADEGLRASLESDADEMAKCAQAGTNKAVHVLAGSIVEALLADHLASLKYADPSGKKVEELDLGQLIAGARSQKVLSQMAVDLASVVKTWRNLIHPGRQLRVKERVDASTAAVAVQLVKIVAAEVAELKRGSYGWTAQQVLSKVENDSSTAPILGDILKETKEREVEALLLRDLPERYVQLLAGDDFGPSDPTALTRLRRLYRLALASAPQEVKVKVARAHVRMLHEATYEFAVVSRERDLFRASDLSCLTSNEAATAKRHLLARLDRTIDESYADCLRGIGAYTTKDETEQLVDCYVRTGMVNRPDPRNLATELLKRLHSERPSGDTVVQDRLLAWEKTFEVKQQEPAQWVASIRSAMRELDELDELPF
jgi:polyhydroxyalkanoate synthesis regulator phasin